jgi:hypothetical protein
MTIEYWVLQALPEEGPFASVIADKGKQSWDTPKDALDELGQQIPDHLVSDVGRHPKTGELLPFKTEQGFGQRTHALAPRNARGDAYALRLHGLNPMAVFSDERLNKRALLLIRQGTRANVLPNRLKVTGVETHDRHPPCRV